jgi:hypothetical protein
MFCLRERSEMANKIANHKVEAERFNGETIGLNHQ